MALPVLGSKASAITSVADSVCGVTKGGTTASQGTLEGWIDRIEQLGNGGAFARTGRGGGKRIWYFVVRGDKGICAVGSAGATSALSHQRPCIMSCSSSSDLSGRAVGGGRGSRKAKTAKKKQKSQRRALTQKISLTGNLKLHYSTRRAARSSHSARPHESTTGRVRGTLARRRQARGLVAVEPAFRRKKAGGAE